MQDLGFYRIWMMYLPEKYVAGEMSIRFLGDTAESETGYHFRLNREYQFVLFGASERDCMSKAVALQRRLKSKDKLHVDGSSYLSLGLFSFSQPFKTEDSDEVYGVIGVLQAEIREAREFEPVGKIGGVNIEVTPINSDGTPIDDEKYKIREGECG